MDMALQKMGDFYNGGLWGKSLSFVESIWNFVFGDIKMLTHTPWKFQLKITSNKKIIAKKALTNLYEMNSTSLHRPWSTETHYARRLIRTYDICPSIHVHVRHIFAVDVTLVYLNKRVHSGTLSTVPLTYLFTRYANDIRTIFDRYTNVIPYTYDSDIQYDIDSS